MRRTIGVVAVALALAVSPLDRWLDASMPRLLLLAMPAWIVLGAIAVQNPARNTFRWNIHGLGGAAWMIGALLFWMVPRSVDAIGTSELADQLMHVSMFTTGLALAASWPVMPFVVRGALAIYGVAMVLALGVFYTSYSALLCGTFDLAQQKATGAWLLRLSPLVVLLVVTAGARSLRASAHRHPGAAAGSAAAPLTATAAGRFELEQEVPT